MAKEWAKFEADYKKLSPSIKAYSEEKGRARAKIVSLALANADEGQSNLAESTATAREDGVTGTALKDFVKNKAFKEALDLFDKSVTEFQTQFRSFESFCKEADDVVAELDKLAKAIEKDLSKRKDKSASKSDIEALLEQIQADKKEVGKCAKLFDVKLNKKQAGYVANFQKFVTETLTEAPEVQKSKKEETEIPQLFVDRIITKNFKRANLLGKEVGEHCDKAMAAAENDLKAAAPHLKSAKETLDGLLKIKADYAEAMDKKRAAVEASKDADKIKKMISAINKSSETAERKFKGTWTTIKKSG